MVGDIYIRQIVLQFFKILYLGHHEPQIYYSVCPSHEPTFQQRSSYNTGVWKGFYEKDGWKLKVYVQFT